MQTQTVNSKKWERKCVCKLTQVVYFLSSSGDFCPRGGGGGGCTLIFSSNAGLDPASTVYQKKSIPILYLDLKKMP